MLAKEWSDRSGIRRLLGLSGWSEVSRFRGLASPQSIEQQYLRWSWVRGGVIRLALISVVSLIGESVYWSNKYGLPIDALKTRWSYKLGAPLPLPKLVEIPAGQFMMGSEPYEEEKPVHPVVIAQPFYLAQTETTFDQYDVFAKVTVRSLPGESNWGRGTQPVINVDWSDASAYANFRNPKNAKAPPVRTPTGPAS